MPVQIFCLSVMLCATGVFLAYKSGNSHYSTGFMGLLFLAGLFALMQVKGTEHAMTFQILDNVVLIGAGALLIVLGIQKSVSHYFYLGIFTILATGLLRYINFIGGYIGTAALFSIFAAILLVSARYWKSRCTQGEAIS
jgi:hypothetical protein